MTNENTNQVTLADLNLICEEVKKLRDEETRLSFEKRQVTEALEAKEKEIIDILIAANMKSYRSPFGMASLAFRTSVKTPKSDEDRQKFFNYLKEKGLYDHMVSVNSQTLNSYYKEEFSAAEQRGDADTFEIPGLTEVTVNPILSFRK